MNLRYVCAVCGGTFVDIEPSAAEDEAVAIFTPAELEHTAILCVDCWATLRERNPELDARYRPRDVYEQFVEIRRAIGLTWLRELLGLAEGGVIFDELELRRLIEEVEHAPAAPVIEL